MKGFVVLPRRWVVERTSSWFGRNRHLNKDHENLADFAPSPAPRSASGDSRKGRHPSQVLSLPAMRVDPLLADKVSDADQQVIHPLLPAGETSLIPPQAN